MNISERIIEGIKTAFIEGEAKINLFESVKDINEATAITGSGTGIGGRTYFDNAFASARYANPFRMGSHNQVISGSDMLFVAKTGNAALQSNPWGYPVNNDTGTPNTDASIWQLPVRVVNARLPIRTAVLSDVNNLDETIVQDLMLEFSEDEAYSMAQNNDQSGSTTTAYGATSGLRGFASYTGGATAAFGTSGTGLTNGLHTIKQVSQGAAAIAYDDIVNLANALPAQYWSMPGTAWHIHPTVISSLRKLKNTAGLPLLIETGDSDGGAGAFLFGWPVIPNPYLPAPAAGAASMYLANWDRFITIADDPQMTIKRMDQTTPGYVVFYAEKRVVTSIRDIFAGVRLLGV